MHTPSYLFSPYWTLEWGQREAFISVWEEASGNFPVSDSETSVLVFSFEGHFIARCYFLFLHLWKLFPRTFLPLSVLC